MDASFSFSFAATSFLRFFLPTLFKKNKFIEALVEIEQNYVTDELKKQGTLLSQWAGFEPSKVQMTFSSSLKNKVVRNRHLTRRG